MGEQAAHLLHFPGRMYCTFVDERGVNIKRSPRLLASLCGQESWLKSLGRIGTADYGLRSRRECNWLLPQVPALPADAAAPASIRKHPRRAFSTWALPGFHPAPVASGPSIAY